MNRNGPCQPGTSVISFRAAPTAEARLERHLYRPGAMLRACDEAASTPNADDRGVYRTKLDLGASLAERELRAARSRALTCSFATTAADLAPGTVVMLQDHPHPALAKPWLITESRWTGTHDGEWKHQCRAVPADGPYSPPRQTSRPRIRGVETATVVGPPGEEIHVDEFGRVRVQFPWDRDHHFTPQASCWVPVSQGWTGAGYGFLCLPRVGQEVLIEFLGGNPDRPMVTGRVHTAVEPPPYPLPAQKTRSGWRTCSSPGAGGYNEIMMDDAAGAELVNVQAERDLSSLVKRDEDAVVGHDRDRAVGHDERINIGQHQHTTVGVNRVALVGASDDSRWAKNTRWRFRLSPEARVPMPPPSS